MTRRPIAVAPPWGICGETPFLDITREFDGDQLIARPWREYRRTPVVRVRKPRRTR